MYTENILNPRGITLDDILKLKEQLTTYYCFVHDEELKQEIEKYKISQIEIKVTPYIEKGQIILIDKNKLDM